MKTDTRVRLAAAEVACLTDGSYLVSEPGRMAVVTEEPAGFTGPPWAVRLRRRVRVEHGFGKRVGSQT